MKEIHTETGSILTRKPLFRSQGLRRQTQSEFCKQSCHHSAVTYTNSIGQYLISVKDIRDAALWASIDRVLAALWVY